MDDREKRALVALGEAAPGDVPVVMFGISDAMIANMRSGIAPDVDLRKAGIPCKVLFVWGETHADIAATLATSLAAIGGTFEDRRKPGQPDLGIDKPTVQ